MLLKKPKLAQFGQLAEALWLFETVSAMVDWTEVAPMDKSGGCLMNLWKPLLLLKIRQDLTGGLTRLFFG